MTDPIPLVLIVVAYLLVRVASQGDGDRPNAEGDPMNHEPNNDRPLSLTEEGYPADSWDAAQVPGASTPLDELQGQEADRLRDLLADSRAALIGARRRQATPERIHRLRELQTVALIMTELLQEEGYPADSLTDD